MHDAIGKAMIPTPTHTVESGEFGPVVCCKDCATLFLANRPEAIGNLLPYNHPYLFCELGYEGICNCN